VRPNGSSSHTSSHVATSFAPCLISVFGPPEFLLVTLPGTAQTSRFCSRAQRETMRVPLYSAASTTSMPADMPLMIRLRMGKFCEAGKVPTELRDARATESHDLLGEPRVFLGVHGVNSGAEGGDRFSLGSDGSAMRRCIDAAHQATDDHHSASGEASRQALGHAAAVSKM
jgi:hypothetical protein